MFGMFKDEDGDQCQQSTVSDSIRESSEMPSGWAQRFKTPCHVMLHPQQGTWGFCSLLWKPHWWSAHYLEHCYDGGKGKEGKTYSALGLRSAIWKWHTSCPPTMSWLKHGSDMIHNFERPGKCTHTCTWEENRKCGEKTSHSHCGGHSMPDLWLLYGF